MAIGLIQSHHLALFTQHLQSFTPLMMYYIGQACNFDILSKVQRYVSLPTDLIA